MIKIIDKIIETVAQGLLEGKMATDITEDIYKIKEEYINIDYKLEKEPIEFDKDWMFLDNTIMSKRFYTACAAMQGILSGDEMNRINRKTVESIVELSYKFADELLKQENL